MFLTSILAYLVMTYYQKIRLRVGNRELQGSTVFAKVLIFLIVITISILSAVEFGISHSYMPFSYPFVLLRHNDICLMYLFNWRVFLFNLRNEPWYDFTGVAPYYFFIIFLFINLIGSAIGTLFAVSELNLYIRKNHMYTFVILFINSLKGVLAIYTLFLILQAHTGIIIIFGKVLIHTNTFPQVFLSTYRSNILSAGNFFLFQLSFTWGPFCSVWLIFTAERYLFLLTIYFYISLAIIEYYYLLRNEHIDKVMRIFRLDFSVVILLILLFHWIFEWVSILFIDKSQMSLFEFLSSLLSWLTVSSILSLSEALPPLVGWTSIAYHITSSYSSSEILRKRKLREVLISICFMIFPIAVYLYQTETFGLLYHQYMRFILNLILLISVWILMVLYCLLTSKITASTNK